MWSGRGSLRSRRRNLRRGWGSRGRRLRRSLRLFVRTGDRLARVAQASARRAQRAAGQLDKGLRSFALRLLEFLLLACELAHDFFGARVAGNFSGQTGTLIAIDLGLADAALEIALRLAGGMVAFLGGTDDAIEFERVVGTGAFAHHLAEIGLVGLSAGDAIGDLAGNGRARGEARASGKTRKNGEHHRLDPWTSHETYPPVIGS